MLNQKAVILLDAILALTLMGLLIGTWITFHAALLEWINLSRQKHALLEPGIIWSKEALTSQHCKLNNSLTILECNSRRNNRLATEFVFLLK